MYISYANLWKTLIDKRISKTELMELTGMSSRTMAKLSRNGTVTTETLLHICEALECGLGDVMELCEGEPLLSLYEAFARKAEPVGEDEFCLIYRLSHEGINYSIKRIKLHANKHTVIHCEQDSILWEQIYPLGHSPVREKTVVSKRCFAARDEQGVVLIDGSPMCMTGLDEQGFVSAKGKKRKEDDVFVMTVAAFKLFDPNEERKS